MSVPEQAGKVASGAIEALKGNPLCLSLVVLMVIVGTFAYLRVSKEMDSDERTMTGLIEHCMGPAKR
jgi:hypothetical protein